MLTPLDVRKKEFRRCFRGYDEQEVDRFLDLVIDTMERLIERNNDLQEHLERVEGTVARYKELEEVLKSTMVIAQKTANEIKESADRQAKSIIEEARAKAEQILAQAREEAKVILNQAHEDGTRVLDEAAGKADRIMNDYEVLQKQTMLFRSKFRSFLEMQLEMLDSELGSVDDRRRPALTDSVEADAEMEWDDSVSTGDEERESLAEIMVAANDDEAEADTVVAAGGKRFA